MKQNETTNKYRVLTSEAIVPRQKHNIFFAPTTDEITRKEFETH